ncbi:MAG: type II secretion system major pseudopilin GspG [Endozoicomonadaceae bacterium]|nr:type II secretion system major pseudopilin GspG [Endozoicomonadaceae bacterium]
MSFIDDLTCSQSEKTKKRRKLQRGFTLIEIMIVVVILGILAALVIPNIMNRPDQAKMTATRSDVKAIASALELYRLDNGNYPSTEQGLEALVTKPEGEPEPTNWSDTGYLKRLPKDPWGRAYQYELPGIKNPNGFDLYSLGANGRQEGEGANATIGNWDE